MGRVCDRVCACGSLTYTACMALMSPPIPVADATPVHFDLASYVPSANVAVHFFTDAEGMTAVAAPASGTRDVTASINWTAREGSFRSPGEVLEFTSFMNDGSIPGMVSATAYELSFGRGAQHITLVAVQNADPVDATTYRIIVDGHGAGSSELG